jgi:hypothetical protein
MSLRIAPTSPQLRRIPASRHELPANPYAIRAIRAVTAPAFDFASRACPLDFRETP